MNDPKEGNSTQEAEDIVLDEEEAAAANEESTDAQPDSGKDGAPVDEEVDPLEEALAEAARWQDIALRSQADLDNYRKRMAREKGDLIKYANVGLLEELLPVLDNFDRGLQAASGDESSTIYQGMSMVLKQLEDFLKEHGVETIDTGEADFDPNVHEAVGHEFSDSLEEGKVIRELRRGFMYKDRLLRAPNIVVSKGQQDKAAAEASAPSEKEAPDA